SRRGFNLFHATRNSSQPGRKKTSRKVPLSLITPMNTKFEHIKESLTVYNALTELCFRTCVREFNHHKLIESETNCVHNCFNFCCTFCCASVKMNIISELGYRQDGRLPHEIRNINFKMNVYSQADGSSYFEQGNTKVLCAVYGPHEPKQRSRIMEDRCIINCQYSMATFSTTERKERPRGDRRSREFARLMEKAFESAILTEYYPRSQIDIFFELLQADGSHLAACVNAGTLALADAGVPMRGLVAAASCACSSDGVPCVDVCSREETSLIPRITIATISGQKEIVLTELQNRLHKNHLSSLLEAAKKATTYVHSCLEAAVTSHIVHAIGLPSDANDDDGLL
ncbi:unnamed protein product, partial [Thelazia callipaeda]|uniref:Putative exosome complex component RRP41 n=1 Tax=Thelazia callipaeda TaxID=103827 RepID=A0A0N5CXF3_THECL